MKIRSGNYTIYKGHECRLFEQRYEVPIADYERQYQVCYDSDSTPRFSDFEKHPFEEMFCKSFFLKELDNAFFVKTCGIYKGISVNVFEFRPNPELLHISLNDGDKAREHSFIQIGNYYLKEINVNELEKIWEERSITEYNLPMPNGLPEYEVIKGD